MIGCATSGGEQEAAANQDVEAKKVEVVAEKKETEVNEVDPYEGFNRKMFYFNDKVDNYVAEPISDAYRWITPQFVQTGIFNFFNNLKNINVVLNDMMQAKFSQSAQDSGRFLMNTTMGLGGLFDVAKHVGWEQNEEDFEQTLAVWGVPQGSYLVMPFLGPTTSRGIPGSVFDTAANPATYVGLPVQLVSMLNSRANAEGALKFIDEAALDPYVFTRESFLQWRNNLATDGKSEASSDLSEIEDELDEAGSDASSSPKNATSQDAAKSPASSTPNVSSAQVKPDSADSDTKRFAKVSDSFDGATQSFDDTAKSFAEANDKLDKLTGQKKTEKNIKFSEQKKAW